MLTPTLQSQHRPVHRLLLWTLALVFMNIMGLALCVRRLTRPNVGRMALVLVVLLGFVGFSPGAAAGITVTAISTGDYHTCALISTGSVKCWGWNGYGGLGDGTTTLRLMPVDVVGLTGSVIAIAAGDKNTCALTSGGAVQCWGYNAGKLGDGTTTNSTIPVDVVGLSSSVIAIAAGGGHTCAVMNSGGVKCWGFNYWGQLGNGTYVDSATPVDVVGLSGSAIAITAAQDHTCALINTGSVQCWGFNQNGELGNGNPSFGRNTPVNVVGLSSGVSAVSAASSGDHTCALINTGEMKCWGNNSAGQLGDGITTGTAVPVDVIGLSGSAISIAAGDSHTCAVISGGGIQCWGDNYNGGFGNGTTTSSLFPVDAIGLGGSATAIAATGGRTCALVSTGTMQCWGWNSYGQIGDGTSTQRLTPVDVLWSLPPTLTPTAASTPTATPTVVSAGSQYTCASTSSGGGKCWGSNSNGQLGDSTTTGSYTPVDVFGLNSNLTAIAAAPDGEHTCAVTSTGAVKCWGWNNQGQLGDGTTIDRNVPVDVVGLSMGVIAVAVGQLHSCALTNTGAVKCWGNNSNGQLGNGTTTDSYTPVDVVGLNSGVTAFTLGAYHTCAVTSTGALKCWGNNYQGQLGDGTTIDRNTPVDVVGLSSGVTTVAGGYVHTCAVTSGGAAKCWGYNNAGQLGDGTMTNRTTPVTVNGLSSGTTAITAGGNHTCALTNTGSAKCWGVNSDGELGDGTTTTRTVPVNVTGLSSGVTGISVGETHACAVISSGEVKCWGANFQGELGDNTTTSSTTPVDVVGFGSSPTPTVTPTNTPVSTQFVGAGALHTCTLTINGGVKCWGSNAGGQLGDGTTTARLTPTDVIGLSSGVTALAVGLYHTCALTTSGGVKCWGANGDGRIGDGTTVSRPVPVDVVGLSSGVQAIAAGGSHTCAITSSGGVKCWGANGNGRLGDGTTTNSLVPVDVVGLNSGVVAITANFEHTCALTSAGGVKCWGYNAMGQLGDNTWEERHTPVDVVGLNSGVSAVGAGAFHTCALTTSGGVKCWGANGNGRLGDGTTTNRFVPTDVTGLSNGVSFLAVGHYHNCALTASGLKCWGYNLYGGLGDGTTTDQLTPVDVSGLTSDVLYAAGGEYHTCAVMSNGGLKCWGWNLQGQLGDGTTVDHLLPADVVFDALSVTPTGTPTNTPTATPTNTPEPQATNTPGPQPTVTPTTTAPPLPGGIPPWDGREVAVIVQGWQGLSHKQFACSLTYYNWLTPNQYPDDRDFALLANELVGDGVEVWFVHLDTGQDSTKSLEHNAGCLRNKLQELKTTHLRSVKYNLVAHSMGGLVSRAYVEEGKFNHDVKRLFTLGTPHQGVQPQVMGKIAALYGTFFPASALNMHRQEGLDQFVNRIDEVNNDYWHRNPEVAYYIVGGNTAYLDRQGFAQLLPPLPGFENDGIVPQSSSTGLAGVRGILKTDEAHTSDLGYPTYFIGRTAAASSSYAHCIKPVLAGNASGCNNAAMSAARVLATAVQNYSYTQTWKGSTPPAGSFAQTMFVEGGDSYFVGTISRTDGAMSLVSPLGQIIDEAYALAHPSVVTYKTEIISGSTLVSFEVKGADRGSWQARLQAGDVMSYALTAYLPTSVTLKALTDKDWYSPGQTVVLKANLSPAQAANQVVATIAAPDGTETTLTMGIDPSGGYSIPFAPSSQTGTYTMRVVAVGSQFNLEAYSSFTVSPMTASLNGQPTESAVDTNGDGTTDAIQISASISTNLAGSYSLIGELIAPDGTIIDQRSAIQDLPMSASTMTFDFDGGAINRSMKNGPYGVHLTLLDEVSQPLAGTTITTRQYSYCLFGGCRVSLPLVRR